MKIIALMDLHGERSKIISLGKRLKAADLVLLVGDLTDFGRATEITRIVETARSFNPAVFAVTGNCDYPETAQTLEEINSSIENQIKQIGEFQFLGLGASLPTRRGNTPNEVSDLELGDRLNSARFALDSEKPLILVSHQPPYHTKNDRIQSGAHIGSKAVREFIQTEQPLICFTGHIHEGAGIDTIGETQIVNPGPAYRGYYVTAEVSQAVSSVEICRQ